MAGILAAAAYAAAAVLVITRPIRKARPKPVYKIKGDEIFRA